MHLMIKIETGNAAFEDYGPAVETARILRELAEHIEQNNELPPHYILLRDLNGNTVGECQAV